MKKDKLIFGLILIITIILTIFSILLLPNEVKIQFNNQGGTFVKKPLAIIMMFGFTFIFDIIYFKSKDAKNLFIAILGIVIHAFMIVVNIFFV